MRCPYCLAEMQKGYVKSSQGIHWGPEKELGAWGMIYTWQNQHGKAWLKVYLWTLTSVKHAVRL